MFDPSETHASGNGKSLQKEFKRPALYSPWQQL